MPLTLGLPPRGLRCLHTQRVVLVHVCSVAKQCRERWHHHLCPGISKAPWSKEEDDIIIELQATIGNKWAEMARSVRALSRVLVVRAASCCGCALACVVLIV